MNLSSYLVAAAALLMALGGCDSANTSEADLLQGDLVETGDFGSRRKDDFIQIQLLAHRGVDPKALRRALGGDRVVPRSLADEFAQEQRLTEAHYWLQIGAENGDGISMQQLSISLRRQNCVRANYWLERALDTGHLPSMAQEEAEENLESYKRDCKATSKTG